MRHIQRIPALIAAGATWLTPTVVWAAEEAGRDRAVGTGVGGLWVLCNISYAGMRAQDHPSRRWRIAAFIFGFPGTLISFLVVAEGGNRAYGVYLPSRPPGAPR